MSVTRRDSHCQEDPIEQPLPLPTAVGFCCVHGFALLATAAATAQTNGTGYALSGLLPHLDRIATLLWPEQPCLRYRSTAAAVTAIRVDHTHPAHLSGPAFRQAGSATSRLGDGSPG